MATWTTPKTNWVGTDRFYAADYRRIEGNIEYICTALGIAYVPMRTVVDGQTMINVRMQTNNIHYLERIYNTLGASWNRGYVPDTPDYGSAWNSRDLNIIESFLLNCKKQLDGEISGNVEYYAGSEIICGDNISVGLL